MGMAPSTALANMVFCGNVGKSRPAFSQENCQGIAWREILLDVFLSAIIIMLCVYIRYIYIQNIHTYNIHSIHHIYIHISNDLS